MDIYGNLSEKHFLLASILFVVLLAISAWKFSSAAPIVGIVFLCVSLGMAISAIVLKHRTAYREGKLTRFTFARNVFLDVFGILLVMPLAALLAQYVSDLVARQVADQLLRLVVAVLVGLVMGIGVGLVVRQLWRHFVKTLPGG